MENESVFPTMKDSDAHCGPSGGITKREYFAAMAMQGMLANEPLTKGFASKAAETDMNTGIFVAAAAILMADSLMAALAEGKA